MKKKISLPIVITIVLLVAAITFSIAYTVARTSFNKELQQFSEKQAQFNTLADVDRWVRGTYTGEIPEEKLTSELCKAYADAIGPDVLYFTAEEFDSKRYVDGKNCETYPLSNGDVMVIMNSSLKTNK